MSEAARNLGQQKCTECGSPEKIVLWCGKCLDCLQSEDVFNEAIARRQKMFSLPAMLLAALTSRLSILVILLGITYALR